MHVRRADYVKIIAKDYPPELFNGSPVNSAIASVLAARRRAIFLVLTDDEAWCRANMQLSARVRLVSTARPELAFAVMRSCNHSIVTIGSFGLWAGILNGGHMVRLLPRRDNNARLIAEHTQNTGEQLPNVDFIFYP